MTGIRLYVARVPGWDFGRTPQAMTHVRWFVDEAAANDWAAAQEWDEEQGERQVQAVDLPTDPAEMAAWLNRRRIYG